MYYVFLQYKMGYGEKDFRGFKTEESLISFLMKEGKGLLIHKIFEVSKEYKLGLIELPAFPKTGKKKRGRPPQKGNKPKSAALKEKFDTYGYHPRCLKCGILEECENPQYNAPGVTKFTCGVEEEEKK